MGHQRHGEREIEKMEEEIPKYASKISIDTNKKVQQLKLRTESECSECKLYSNSTRGRQILDERLAGLISVDRNSQLHGANSTDTCLLMDLFLCFFSLFM